MLRSQRHTSNQSYRCYPKDGCKIMEFINALRILNERAEKATAKSV